MKFPYSLEQIKKFTNILNSYNKKYYSLYEFKVFNSIMKNIEAIAKINSNSLFAPLYDNDNDYMEMKKYIDSIKENIEKYKEKYRNSFIHYWQEHYYKRLLDKNIEKEIEKYKNNENRQQNLYLIEFGGLL